MPPELRQPLPRDLQALPALQAEILRSAAAFVRPGGRLMYSTCTVCPAENERVTQEFLQKNSFETVRERQIFTGDLTEGAGGDGFYYCLMRKKDL